MTNCTPDPSRSDLPYAALPHVEMGAGFRMLSGVRIVDVTTSIAGPYATMLLSDFGAEVIKVERPEGDDSRKWGPPFLDEQALWFSAVNRNKKSVVIDAGDDEGKARLIRLIRTADVFVTNQPPDVQRKLGLDADSIRKIREDIVFVSITGFGLTGARANLTSYDLIAEGYSGIMDITGDGDGAPQKIGAPAADMLAGQDAAMATLAALIDRMKGGGGSIIDISLAESMTRFLSCRISSYLGSGEVPRRSGGTDSVIAIYQPFETADLPINLGLGSDGIWKRFWKTLGDPEYGARAEFATNSSRRDHRNAIVARIQKLLLGRSRQEWLAAFAENRIPAGPINRVDEVTADRDFHARGLFYAVTSPSGNVVPQVGLGIQIDGRPSTPIRVPPYLGEHTSEILDSLPDEDTGADAAPGKTENWK
ncbi:CaiB/BaiF CoA transferase family protein [Salipiger sp.]|uniref:CaiB/BaiF CoA transferase family protein n=1 Tax=Salipiger sp. TaxID=2078585 RepID=UPI003A976FD4